MLAPFDDAEHLRDMLDSPGIGNNAKAALREHLDGQAKPKRTPVINGTYEGAPEPEEDLRITPEGLRWLAETSEATGEALAKNKHEVCVCGACACQHQLGFGARGDQCERYRWPGSHASDPQILTGVEHCS